MRYKEIVPEQSSHPDYDKALEALGCLLESAKAALQRKRHGKMKGNKKKAVPNLSETAFVRFGLECQAFMTFAAFGPLGLSTTSKVTF